MTPRLLALQGVVFGAPRRSLALQGVVPGSGEIVPSGPDTPLPAPSLNGGGMIFHGKGLSRVYNHALKQLVHTADVRADNEDEEEMIILQLLLEIAHNEL